jgi:hypothetical protein
MLGQTVVSCVVTLCNLAGEYRRFAGLKPEGVPSKVDIRMKYFTLPQLRGP